LSLYGIILGNFGLWGSGGRVLKNFGQLMVRRFVLGRFEAEVRHMRGKSIPLETGDARDQKSSKGTFIARNKEKCNHHKICPQETGGCNGNAVARENGTFWKGI